MRTLILAIETAGESWDELDAATRADLTRQIDRSAQSDAERAAALEDVVRDLRLSPLTGRIAALAVCDRERAGTTAYDASSGNGADTTTDSLRLRERDEATLLQEFWDGARHYDAFVTFSGRNFALPFLLLRSVTCGVRPTVDLLRSRYLSRQHPPYHIDLADEFSFYGALPHRPSLSRLCHTFGIACPQGEEPLSTATDAQSETASGSDRAMTAAAAVRAASALYDRWLTYLAPPEFLNKLD